MTRRRPRSCRFGPGTGHEVRGQDAAEVGHRVNQGDAARGRRPAQEGVGRSRTSATCSSFPGSQGPGRAQDTRRRRPPPGPNRSRKEGGDGDVPATFAGAIGMDAERRPCRRRPPRWGPPPANRFLLDHPLKWSSRSFRQVKAEGVVRQRHREIDGDEQPDARVGRRSQQRQAVLFMAAASSPSMPLAQPCPLGSVSQPARAGGRSGKTRRRSRGRRRGCLRAGTPIASPPGRRRRS